MQFTAISKFPTLANKILATASILLATTAISATSANAASGLTTLAASPDGTVLLAGGSNRVIYTLDPESLKVTARHWIKYKPKKMEFTADGSILLLQGNHSVLRAVDPKTFKVKKKLRHAKRYAYAPGANKIVLATGTYKYKEKKYYTTIRVVDAKTYKEESKIEILGQLSNIAVDDMATTVSLLTYGKKDPSEEKGKTNSDMSAAEKIEFRQKHDQRSSEHVVISLKDGSSKRHKSWFSSNSGGFLKRTAEGVLYIPSWSGAVMMKDSGEVEFVDTGVTSQNSGYQDPETKTFVTGGYSSISIKAPDDEEVTVYKLKRLKDTDRAVNIIKSNDVYFASTDGFRVVRFDLSEGVDRVKPVY